MKPNTTPEATRTPELATADREQRNRDLQEVFGIAASALPDDLKDKIYGDRDLMEKALQAKYGEHPDLAADLQNDVEAKRAAKAVGGAETASEQAEIIEDASDLAPEGLPTTTEAEQASAVKKSLVSRLAQKSLGLGKGAAWFLTSPIRATQYGVVALYGKAYDASQKANLKTANLTGEERDAHVEKVGRRANLIAWGAGALYLTYIAATKTHGFGLFESTGATGAANPADLKSDPKAAIDQGRTGTANSTAPELQDMNSFKGAEFVYGPALDPALSANKHGNDWGTDLLSNQESIKADTDAGKPHGYSEFFNNRIKQSPEEFSATLTEFGLNGKGSAAINDMADKLRADPAFAQDKYDELMKEIGKAKVSEMTYDGSYGSYYAVANPDKSVTLSYDTVVAGEKGNRFLVYEMPDGTKHYMHTDCGGQWSHIKMMQPAQHGVGQSYQPQGGGSQHITRPRVPVDRPPVDNPPVDNPPVEEPPVEEPPIEEPPILEPKDPSKDINANPDLPEQLKMGDVRMDSGALQSEHDVVRPPTKYEPKVPDNDNSIAPGAKPSTGLFGGGQKQQTGISTGASSGENNGVTSGSVGED